MSEYTRILTLINNCDDPEKLEIFIQNARRKNVAEVRDAAMLRLASILPAFPEGSLEYDFWRTLCLYEITLSGKRRTKVRLNKTRAKVESSGLVQTLSDWTEKGLHRWIFNQLITDGMMDYTGEAVILRHSKTFSPKTRAAARKRLADAGINVEDRAKPKRALEAA